MSGVSGASGGVDEQKEEMPGFLKAVDKLGGEVVDVKPVRKLEGKRLS